MDRQVPDTARPMVEVRNLRKEYPLGDETVVALKCINLRIMRGEVCCIFGTSGSGKSTLLNQLAGMEKPTRGGVRINGVVISRLNEAKLAKFRQDFTGFVFQSYNLLPNLTATENVALPLMFQGVPKAKREHMARALLRKVGLGHRLGHYPGHPAVVFADEPTGNLDSKTTKEVMEMICRFAKTYQQTIILVTHDPEMAGYADHIVTLVDGEIIKEEIGGNPV